jgi:hypothetical protein
MPIAPSASPERFEPEALEERRFDRDRSQAVMVLVALTIPMAAFGINDWLILGNDWPRLALVWSGRAAVVLALAATGVHLRRAPNRARFERILFGTLMAGVLFSILTHFGRPRNSLLPTRFELLCVVGFYVALHLRTLLQAVPAILLSVSSVSLVIFWHTDVYLPELVSIVVCFLLANVLGILIAVRRNAAEAEEDAAWRAVTFAHASLQRAARELRALRSVVPICPTCRKVRGAREAWQQLESFVAERGDVEFSQILCPSCLQKEFGAVLPPEDAPA